LILSVNTKSQNKINNMFQIIYLLFIIAGVIAGTFTGLVPGVHINLVSLLVVIILGRSKISSLFILNGLACFIVAMAITHTFVDFLPSIFLGTPDEGTVLSVLPGHRFLLKGFGYAAFRLTLLGSALGLIIATLFLPLYMIIVPFIYGFIKRWMFFVLLGASVILIMSERRKFSGLVIFLLSGILGLVVLNFKHIQQPLFPLLTGLFGVSMLTVSIITKVKIPKQKLTVFRTTRKEKLKALTSGIFSASLVSFLPGLGSGQAAVIGNGITKLNDKGFLILLGSINTIVMLFSIAALYIIGKPRTGSAVMIKRILGELTLSHVIMFAITALIASIMAFIISIKLGRLIAKKIHKINYTKLSIIVILFVIGLTTFISGPYSLMVIVASTALGVYTNFKGIRRIHLMGCLLIPVMIYYWPF